MFDLERMISYMPRLTEGAILTTKLTIASMALASVVGMVMALGRMSERRWISGPSSAFVEVMRNLPELVVLYYVFFVLPSIGLTISAFQAAVLALAFYFGSLLAEVYRGGIQSIDKGQWEAALTLDMSYWLTMRRIILPQAIRNILPAWGNYFIGCFKTTALASAITVRELTFNANYIAGYNFRYFEVFSLTTLLYFVISFPAIIFVRRFESRLQKGRRTSTPTI